MKAKKVKDLAAELMDDLLGNEKSVKVDLPEVPASVPETAIEIENNDATLRLGESSVMAVPTASVQATSAAKSTVASLSFDVGSKVAPAKYPIKPSGSTLGRGADASLLQSENLRIAQQKIFELEQEVDRVRRESEKLAAAGETIRRRLDELLADNEFKTKKVEDLKERLTSEKEIFEESNKAKEREIKEMRMSISEYEMRLSTNLQKIRVRERELENRLELVKMENTAIVRNKDEIILDLKRQIDQVNSELENYRVKGQDLNRQLGEKQEVLRRTVKALRLALSMLEGGQDDSGSGQKVS